MRLFYNTYPLAQISGTVSRELLPAAASDISESPIRKSSTALVPVNSESLIRNFTFMEWSQAFPLSWTHYVHLLRRSRSPEARAFYETEALRGGWTVRQLDRQMSTLFYERTALSRNKAAMLRKGARPRPSDRVTPEEEIKHPLVLEFLGLKDEYFTKDHAVARYALAGLDHKILSAEYRLALPSEKTLTAELEQTRRALELRRATQGKLRCAKRANR